MKLLTQATVIEDEEENYEIDLTYVGGAGGAVCTFSFVDEKIITEIDLEHEEVLHVRTMNCDEDKLEEIVFDSRADASALPLRFSQYWNSWLCEPQQVRGCTRKPDPRLR